MKRTGSSQALVPPLFARTVVAALALLLVAARTDGSDRMEEIIRNVAANETLYENIEFKLELKYRHGSTMQVRSNTVLTSTTRFHQVHQDGLIFFDRESHYETPHGRDGSRVALAYDGEVTTTLDGNAANVRHYRYEGSSLLRPHTLVKLDSHEVKRFPLSRTLSTGDFGEFLVPSAKFEAEETVDGLSCLRVRVEFSRPGWTTRDHFLLRLCPDRNYIAVKNFYCATNYADSIPVHTSLVSDFRELEPGIWFPFSYSETTNYEVAAAQGKSVVSRSSEARVTEARLDPDHPRSFFQLPIPDGTIVYEVADEEIIDGYFQGGPRVGPRRTWLWWLIGLLSVAAVAAYLKRRQRSFAFGRSWKMTCAAHRIESRRPAAVLAAIALCAAGTHVAAGRADERMAEIVRNVAANEKLYENVEYRLELNYRHGRSVPAGRDTVLAKTSRWHVVYQDGLILFERQSHRTTRNGESDSRDVLAYDGEVTRSLDVNAANVRRYRFEGSGLLRPHTIVLLDTLDMKGISLSRILGTGHFGDFIVQTAAFQAEETVSGVSCLRVRLEVTRPGWETPDFSLLWLCADRNYIPVKFEGYATNYTNVIPLHTAYVGDFRELEPGIWFPFSYSETTNYEMAAAEGKTIPLRSSEARVTEARLDPDHPQSFFQLPIPDGTIVYEVADEEILDGYIQGAPRVGPRRTWLWWLIGLVAVAAIAVYLKRRQGGLAFG